MKKLLALVLLIFSLPVAASNAGPLFDAGAFYQPVGDNTAHFDGYLIDGNLASTAQYNVTFGVNFGDGQAFEETQPRGQNIFSGAHGVNSFAVNHTYAFGNYTATVLINAVGYFLFFPANGNGPEDLQQIPLNYHFERSFAITAVPEPSNLAMLLAGLGVLGFAARRRKQKVL